MAQGAEHEAPAAAPGERHAVALAEHGVEAGPDEQAIAELPKRSARGQVTDQPADKAGDLLEEPGAHRHAAALTSALTSLSSRSEDRASAAAARARRRPGQREPLVVQAPQPAQGYAAARPLLLPHIFLPLQLLIRLLIIAWELPAATIPTSIGWSPSREYRANHGDRPPRQVPLRNGNNHPNQKVELALAFSYPN